MANMTTVEIKAFVPSKDFDLSKRFYQDLGFELAWSDDDLAYFRHDGSSFLLQNFYNAEHAANFMMHLLVEDVDAWWLKTDRRAALQRNGKVGHYRLICEADHQKGCASRARQLRRHCHENRCGASHTLQNSASCGCFRSYRVN